jgi:ankyrin repeat protein
MPANESLPTGNPTASTTSNTAEALPILHMACNNQSVAGVTYILSIGKDPNEKTAVEEWTPLWIAACHGNLELARLLLDAGADVNATTRKGLTALREAALIGATEIVQLLLERGADPEIMPLEFQDPPLLAAASRSHTETVKLLLDVGANVNAQQSGGWSALHYALLHKSKETVALILDHSPDVNAATMAHLRPLHLAAMAGFTDVGLGLLTRGAEIDATDDGGLTALRVAVQHGELETVKMLVERGARTDIVSHKDKLSLIDIALVHGHINIFHYLQQQQQNSRA